MVFWLLLLLLQLLSLLLLLLLLLLLSLLPLALNSLGNPCDVNCCIFFARASSRITGVVGTVEYAGNGDGDAVDPNAIDKLERPE